MIFKDILGVHNKASNLAVKHELGTFPICIKALVAMFKYNQRIERLKKCTESQNKILIAAKVENDYLQNSGSNFYWQKHLFILKDRLKLPSLDISSELFNGSLVSFYKENVKAELEQIK